MQRHLVLLLLLAADASATTAATAADRFVVTNLRWVSASSPAEALDACARDVGGVSAAWRLLCHTRVAVSAIGDSTAVLQRVAVGGDGFFSSTTSSSSSACPLGTSLLPSAPPGVALCVAYAAAAREAVDAADFIEDVAITSERSYNNDRPGWRTDPRGMARQTTENKTSKTSKMTPIQQRFLSFRRPVRAITALHVLRHVAAVDVSSCCVRALGAAWSVAGDGGLAFLDEPHAKSKAVLCVEQRAPQATTPFARLAEIALVDAHAACAVGFQQKQTLTRAVSMCSKWRDASADELPFITDLLLHRVDRSRGESRDPTSHAFLPGGFRRVARRNLNAGVSHTPAYLFTRRWMPLRFTPSPALAKPPLNATAHVSLHAWRGHQGDVHAQLALSFKILQLADLHYTGDPSWACRDAPADMGNCTEAVMAAWVDALLDTEKPDFVAFTGDNVETFDGAHHAAAMDAVVAQVEARGVPYAMIFGNHDDENGFPREQLADMAVHKPFSYTQRGPREVDGVGNYELDVHAPTDGPWGSRGTPVFRMYFLDSHGYPDRAKYPLTHTAYDWVKPNQIAFYRNLSETHAQKNNRVPAVMFFHIPLIEYNANAPSATHGEQHEAVSSSDVNTNLFSTLVDMGDVKATFVGHDHVNEYCVQREGIQLCYGGGAGFGQAYGRRQFVRRARVIEWSVDATGERSLRSWRRHFGDLATRHREELLYTSSFDKHGRTQ